MSCAVENCDKRLFARGWCYRHYMSNSKYGSPDFIDSEQHLDAMKALFTSIGKKVGATAYWRGRKRGPHSAETIAKMSAAQIGKPKSPEHRAKIADFIHRTKKGIKRPHLGAIISKSLAARSPEEVRLWRERLRQTSLKTARRGAANHMWGISPSHGHPGGKWIEHNGIKFRSNYEVRMAKALDDIGIRWQYEPRRFDLGTCTYLPDFYIPEDGYYIETKGYFDEVSKTKLSRFRELFPDIPLVVANDRVIKMFEVRV